MLQKFSYKYIDPFGLCPNSYFIKFAQRVRSLDVILRSVEYNGCLAFTNDMSVFNGFTTWDCQTSLASTRSEIRFSSQLIAKLGSYPYTVSPNSCGLLFCGQDLTSCKIWLTLCHLWIIPIGDHQPEIIPLTTVMSCHFGLILFKTINFVNYLCCCVFT